MLYVCVPRFDVMGERENILGWHVKWTQPDWSCMRHIYGSGRWDRSTCMHANETWAAMHVVDLASFRSRSETMHAWYVHLNCFQIQGRQISYVKVTCICMCAQCMAMQQGKAHIYHGTLLYASFIAANRHTWRMQRPHDPFLFPS
jgi:hypothetical protein